MNDVNVKFFCMFLIKSIVGFWYSKKSIGDVNPIFVIQELFDFKVDGV